MKLLHDSPRYCAKSFAGDSAFLLIDKASGAERVFWGDSAIAFQTAWEAPPCVESRAAMGVAIARLDAILARLWPTANE